jgi:hypothetical protein
MKYTAISQLPTDRAFLHFEATRLSDGKVQVDYELVIPLKELDCRGTSNNTPNSKRPKSYRVVWLDGANNKRIPLGRTGVGTSNRTYPFYGHPSRAGEIDLPFRDGAHCSWDNEKLGGLQVIYTRGGEHWLLTKEG